MGEKEGLKVCSRSSRSHLTEPDGGIRVVKKLMDRHFLDRKKFGEQKLVKNTWIGDTSLKRMETRGVVKV